MPLAPCNHNHFQVIILLQCGTGSAGRTGCILRFAVAALNWYVLCAELWGVEMCWIDFHDFTVFHCLIMASTNCLNVQKQMFHQGAILSTSHTVWCKVFVGVWHEPTATLTLRFNVLIGSRWKTVLHTYLMWLCGLLLNKTHRENGWWKENENCRKNDP